MKRLVVITVLALAFAVVPAWAEDEAAEPRYRCSSDLQTCLDWMAKHYAGRGWAGMQLDVEGFLYTVTTVKPGSPAEQGGIRVGDVLVAVNGVEFAEENREKLVAMQGKMLPGAKFTYTLKRGGKRRNVDFVLVEMPLEVVAQVIGMHLITDHLDVDLAFGEAAD